MHAYIEVPADTSAEFGLAQLMLAEHGPTGVVLLIIALLVWKVVVPGLQAAGKMLRDFFDHSLKQGAENNTELKALRESMTEMKAVVAAGDEHTRRELESVRHSLEAALAATTAHVKSHDRELETIRTKQGEHERRLIGLELQAGNSGVYRHPHTPPSPPSTPVQ